MKERTFRCAGLVGMALLTAVVTVAGQTVVTEPHVTLRSGGKGQKPFDVTRHTIPLTEIADGGPPRDEIPALVDPWFVSADRMRDFLKDSERVLGVVVNGEAKAYPIRILNWHELVNDSLGGRPILVSW